MPSPFDREELLPGTSVTLCPLPKSYRLDLQVGKCKGTPFIMKNKDSLNLIYLKTEEVIVRSSGTQNLTKDNTNLFFITSVGL